MDGQSPIIPAPADVAAVQAAIDVLRPVIADCQVVAPIGDPLTVTIADLQPDTPATRGAIGDATNALLLRDAQPGGTLWLKRLTAAISDADGVESFNLVLPTANVVSASGHIPIFAPVIFH